MSRRKLLSLLIVLLTLGIGAVIGLALTGELKGIREWLPFGKTAASGPATPADEGPDEEIDLGEILATIDSRGTRENHFLRLTVTLRVSKSEKRDVEFYKPRVIDAFQVHIREIGIADVTGAANIKRLSLEMKDRINAALAPHKVKEVLFREVKVQ
jgi:flagellar FliL protein